MTRTGSGSIVLLLAVAPLAVAGIADFVRWVRLDQRDMAGRSIVPVGREELSVQSRKRSIQLCHAEPCATFPPTET